MFVLGTAGHIDHGKSVLVRALTGIDPDRLREEKERGMTIDLGFAWLKLPGGAEVGIVDVPGHEAFIRNMVAGVGGIDAALLVVDASEGIMPQTREHLAILRLLEVPRLVAVITKKDLVDEDWLQLVKSEVEGLLEASGMPGSPIVAVSALTREGLDDLVGGLDRLLGSAEPRPDRGRPRLWIDRSFSIAGSGTVVTGTLVDGRLNAGEQVQILPSGLEARVRGLQTHKSRVAVATPGSRVGVNLVGVSMDQVGRGDLLTLPGWLRPTALVSVRCRLLSDAPRAVRHNATVNFYAGTGQTSARIRLLDRDVLLPGDGCLAQASLARPMPLVRGDRFVLRSPEHTLGGGQVLEAQARRHRRFRPRVMEALEGRERGTSEEVILAALEARRPVALSVLARETDLPFVELEREIDALAREGKLVLLGRGEQRMAMTSAEWARLADRAVSVLQEYHRGHPARVGMPRTELGSRLGLEQQSGDLVQRLVKEGRVVGDGSVLRLPAHSVRLTEAQRTEMESFLRGLRESRYSPPTGATPGADLLSLLLERREIVKVGEFYFAASAYDAMVQAVTGRLKDVGKITVGEVRDMFNTSRKYAVAFLEHLDRIKLTRRVGDERVLFR